MGASQATAISMVQPDFDAIVVGAGPSGSSCAALLSGKGFKILLLDKAKFPRDKVCGDAVGGKALNVLAALGIEEELRKKGFLRSSGIIFSSPSGDEVEIPIANDTEMAGGFVCRRKEFDSIVFSHARKKCDVLENAEAVDQIMSGTHVAGVKVKTADGTVSDFFAKIVIGADGASSLVARKTGLAKFESAHSCSAVRGYYSGIKGLRGNIEIHFLPECMPGYFWIFPLSDNEANVGVGMLLDDIVKRKLNLSVVLEKCLKNEKFATRFAGAKLEGEIGGWTLPLASAKRRCAGNGFVLLGDAASLIDPFSGEGVGNGMKSAAIAADIIGAALAKGVVNEQDCLLYEKTLWQEIGPDVKSSYMLQKLGKMPFLLNFVIGRAKKKEWIRKELAGMIANKEAKKKAADPMFYLRLLVG